MNRGLSILRVILGFTFVATTATVCIALTVLLLPWRVTRIKLVNYYGKLVGLTITKLAGTTLEVVHRERIDASFPAIYVANHASHLDAFLSIWLCPVGGCGVMKKEVVKIPFFGQLYLLSGHLRIDRGHRDRAIAALEGIGTLVRKHRLAIWIMPEGTRSRTGRLLPFKSGFVHLAIATGLPVVPLVFHGAQRIWPPGTLTLTPGTVRVEVLEPVSTGAWRVETAAQHAADVHDRMAAALPEDQRPEALPAPAAA